MNTKIYKFSEEFSKILYEKKDSIAFIDYIHETNISYSELENLIQKLNKYIEKDNIKESIVSLLPNSVETLVVFLSSAYFGHSFAPIEGDVPITTIKDWIELTRPTLLFIPNTINIEVITYLEKLKIRIIQINIDGKFSWLNSIEDYATPDSSNSMLYIKTSGSTGEPKAMAIIFINCTQAEGHL
jgi:acyl-coenzyme A synthetase/AMP-(fatty) acid ligase